MCVFTGSVDKSIRVLWNKINIALILHCLPSEVDNEARKDIEALKIILAARNEYNERNNEQTGR